MPENATGVALRSTLLLSDGTRFEGAGFGPTGISAGELIFTTAMTGYQEALTDPSYRGQILLFTYPLIGNYGILPGRDQSHDIHPRAVIVSTLSSTPIQRTPLAGTLAAAGIRTMHDVDTRAIVRHVRAAGAMPAALAVYREGDGIDNNALAGAIDTAAYDETDFVREVVHPVSETVGNGSRRIVLLDCGNKQDVTSELVARDCTVFSRPAGTDAAEIIALHPDGVVISNGPGNPARADEVIETVRDLMGQVPIFGICLGHQLLALAAGARTYKLPFGHRGANHPVIDCETGRAWITTQNHGYAVDSESLPPELTISHRNLNDNTVEGLRHRTLPIRSVQFHPEGAPGPRDAGPILDSWLNELPTHA